MRKFYDIGLKLRINAVILILLVVILSSLGYYLYNEQKRIAIKEADERMYSQLDDLCHIMQSQLTEKQKTVNFSLALLHDMYYKNGSFSENYGSISQIEARNQTSDDVQDIRLPMFMNNGRPIYNENSEVDKIKTLGGEAATVFQRIPQGYLRIATNIRDSSENRVINTFIPRSSPVVKAIEKGQTFHGRAYVINDWYVTAYEPIYINKKVKGMLFSGVKEKDIALMKKIFSSKKYYTSGYPYLVDNEGNIVIHPTVESGSLKETTPFEQMMSNKKKMGKSRYLWPEDETGQWKWQYFKYFKPYEAFVSVTIYEKDLFAAMTEIRNIITIGVLISILVFYLGVSLLISPIIKAINKSVAFAEQLAKGNLIAEIDINQKDELGKLSNALRTMAGKIKEVVLNIHTGANNIAAASAQMSSGSQQLSQGTTEQASSTEEVSSSMEEILSNIEQNTENSIATEKLAIAVNENIEESNRAAQTAISAMECIAEKITIINDIAYQTNILALNAAVEAARAGEYGKGFAVVAAEVRNLAERARIASAEIDELSKNGVEISQNAGRKLEIAVPDIQKTSKLVQEVAASSMEMSSGVNQVNVAIQQLNQVTQQNAAVSEELATSSEELAAQADQLRDIVGYFKVFAVEDKELQMSIAPKIIKMQEPQHVVTFNEIQNSEPKDQGNGFTVNLSDSVQMPKESDYEKF